MNTMLSVASLSPHSSACNHSQDPVHCFACSPLDPTKFFGCELGAQTQFDLKRDRYIVNGSHEADKLQDLLDVFIKKFVLCPECDNPETVYSVHQKSQIINNSCQACGFAGM